MTNKDWIQKATKNSKSGLLHNQLGIPKDKTILTSLLVHIKNCNVGDKFYIRNYSYDTTKHGYIKITKLMKRRVQFALNVRK